MHILFLTDNFPPEVNAPASRTYEHAREWVKEGHKVTVITCAPNFPKGKVYKGYKNRIFLREGLDGINIIRVWTFIMPNSGFFLRVLDYMSFMISSFIASFNVKKVDIIVATSPQFFTAVSGYLISKAKNKPWIFELRDIWPESIKAVGALSNSFLLNLLEKLELLLYRSSSRIIAVTNSFKENLISRGIDENKIDVITNGVDVTRYKKMNKDTALVAQYNLKDKFICGYIGTHGLAHSLDTIILSAEILMKKGFQESIHFLFIGNGAKKSELISLAKEKNVRNITFIDSVKKSDVIRYWSLLDISLIHLKKSDLFHSVIPSKIFESMAMGIPVLHSVPGESSEIITRNNIGICTDPENEVQMADAIIKLFNSENLLTEYSKNSVKSSLKFDRRNLALRMLRILESEGSS